MTSDHARAPGSGPHPIIVSTQLQSDRHAGRALATPNVLLVFPKFNPNSFWNLQALCDIRGARCPAPPLGLITVAALLPPSWNVRLVNRNAEELTERDLEW